MRYLSATLATLALSVCLSPVVRAQTGPVGEAAIEAIDVGFAGKYKVGHWTPIWITVRGLPPGVLPRVDLTTLDGDGVRVTYRDVSGPYTTPLDSGRNRLLQYVKFGRTHSSLEVRLSADNRTLAERRFSVRDLPGPESSTQRFILVLGASIGEQEAIRRKMRDQAEHITVCQIDEPLHLPRRWHGYEGVDTVVVATSETSVLEAMDAEQFEAFRHWLQLGGRLVLCVGRRGEEVLAPGSRLAFLAPGKLLEVSAQRSTSGLEDFASATERLDNAGGERIRRFSIDMTMLTDVQGLIESSEIGGPTGQLPTIIRHVYGLGRVDFLAFDPELSPFDRWQGRPTLVARVLDDGSERRGQTDQDSGVGQISHLGYDDLVGQLRAGMDQFVGVTRVNFSWVASLIVIYILLIGPVDYYLLKRFQRMHWTWLTFPLLVAGFCVLAIVFAMAASGDRLHVNHVDVVDVDVDRGIARGTTWMHVYSPTTQAFDLRLQMRLPVAGADTGSGGHLFTWHGLPGHGLGGLNTRATAALFAEGYRVQGPAARLEPDESEILGMPIQVSSSKALMARVWTEVTLPDSGELTIDSNGLLSGRLVNPLGIGLSDCMILYRNWSYPLSGSLGPGESVGFDGLSPRNLEWRLTRRRVVDTKDVSTPWDPMSLDVPRILEVLMFYRAAGGRSYTGLTDHYQAYLDLSEHLRMGRAILVGRGPEPVTALIRDGDSLRKLTDRHWTIYRVVFPVQRDAR